VLDPDPRGARFGQQAAGLADLAEEEADQEPAARQHAQQIDRLLDVETEAERAPLGGELAQGLAELGREVLQRRREFPRR
jgi:hypothetical protein